MKQATLRFPVGKAPEVAKFLAEQGIFTNLSWMHEDGFFAKEVICIITFPEDKETLVRAQFQMYIKTK